MSPIIIDAIVGVILLLSTIIATMRGFVREMLTILGLIGSLAATWFWGGILKMFYSAHLTKWAESKIEEKTDEAVTHLPVFGFDFPIDILAAVASYGSVFAFSFLVLALLNLYISSLVQDSDLSVIDRSLGAVFGIARGLILVVLLYMPVSLFFGAESEKPEWIANARSVPLLEYTVDFTKEHILPVKNDENDNSDQETAKSDEKEEDIKGGIKSLVEKAVSGAKDDGKVKGYEGEERDKLDSLIEKEMKQDN